VPNIKYFRDQEIYVENLAQLVPQLSWDLIGGPTMKWLSYDDPKEEYNDENPHVKFGLILVGELGAFLNLKSAENYFRPENPEFSLQLLLEDSTLDVLKDLLSRRGEGYAINNPLRIKVPESELSSDSFSTGDPFPDRFDGTSTTDTDDGPIISASVFTAGDKVAVQVWFGSYNFNNRTGLTFRLLKLWRLQPGVSSLPSKARDPSPHAREGDNTYIHCIYLTQSYFIPRLSSTVIVRRLRASRRLALLFDICITVLNKLAPILASQA
jgi:hypothetical protein